MLKHICKELLLTRSVPSYVQARAKSWNPHFVAPIVTKNELKEVEQVDEERFSSLQYHRVKSLDPFKSNNEFYDPFLYKLVGRVLRKGARERADKLIRETLFLIKKDRMEKCRELEPEFRAKFERNPIVIMKQALENCKPVLSLKQVTRGGAKYMSPVSIPDKEKDKIVYSWMREVIENRPRPRIEKFPQAFAKELLLAYKNEGKLIKKKIDLYKLAEANKAYVNYIYMKQKGHSKFGQNY